VTFVALNPQPLPPGGTLDFVAVAAAPPDTPGAQPGSEQHP
jgi:hypothetical protein